MQELVSGYDLLFIDEAQRIENIGLNLKILHDAMKELRIIVTGSSSFELANKIQEPLTGRTRTFTLYPIAISELVKQKPLFDLKKNLDAYLIYGMYPELFSLPNNFEKEQHLKELTQAYLYKDVLELLQVRYPQKIHDLLRLLAYQVGSQVSISELAKILGLNHETVTHYINLLEKSFVIFRLGGLSQNLRKEVSKMDKIYFYDLGVRNAIIGDFKTIAHRNDIGQLWENFVVLERQKYLAYRFKTPSTYYWRIYTGAELDYVEEDSGHFLAVEIKYHKMVNKMPKSFSQAYPNSEFMCITRDNFLEFVT